MKQRACCSDNERQALAVPVSYTHLCPFFFTSAFSTLDIYIIARGRYDSKRAQKNTARKGNPRKAVAETAPKKRYGCAHLDVYKRQGTNGLYGVFGQDFLAVRKELFKEYARFFCSGNLLQGREICFRGKPR